MSSWTDVILTFVFLILSLILFIGFFVGVITSPFFMWLAGMIALIIVFCWLGKLLYKDLFGPREDK